MKLAGKVFYATVRAVWVEKKHLNTSEVYLVFWHTHAHWHTQILHPLTNDDRCREVRRMCMCMTNKILIMRDRVSLRKTRWGCLIVFSLKICVSLIIYEFNYMSFSKCISIEIRLHVVFFIPICNPWEGIYNTCCFPTSTSYPPADFTHISNCN